MTERVRIDYTDLVSYSAERARVSYHKARIILTSFSQGVQNATKKGESVEIRDLMDISFSTRRGTIYDNIVFGYDEQVQYVYQDLGVDKLEIKSVISLYLNKLKELGKLGYQVNIKGIGYITPIEEDGVISVTTRNSPVLDKPEIAEFLLLDKKGTLSVTTLQMDELRFKIDLSEGFELPEQFMTKSKTELKLDYIDI